jgi:hypothetical protein
MVDMESGRRRTVIIFGMLALPLLPACLGTGGSNARNLLTDGPKTSVLDGQVVVADGQVTQVKYKKPFLSPPKLEILEIAQSWSRETPFRMSDFKVAVQKADSFSIENDHSEQFWGSYAVLKWRAEGMAGPDKKDTGKPPDPSFHK